MTSATLFRSCVQRRHLLLPRLFSSSGTWETRQAWNPAQPHSSPTDDGDSAPQHLSADENCSPDKLPPILRQVYRCLLEMGQKPGINCVVGDGLATVPIGLFMNNKKVALELESQQDEAVFQPGRTGSSYVQSRVHEATLRAHDWKISKVSEQRWKLLTEYGYSASGKPPMDPEAHPTPVVTRLHAQYLKDILNEVSKDEGGHAHQHHDGCCGGSH